MLVDKPTATAIDYASRQPQGKHVHGRAVRARVGGTGGRWLHGACAADGVRRDARGVRCPCRCVRLRTTRGGQGGVDCNLFAEETERSTPGLGLAEQPQKKKNQADVRHDSA